MSSRRLPVRSTTTASTRGATGRTARSSFFYGLFSRSTPTALAEASDGSEGGIGKGLAATLVRHLHVGKYIVLADIVMGHIAPLGTFTSGHISMAYTVMGHIAPLGTFTSAQDLKAGGCHAPRRLKPPRSDGRGPGTWAEAYPDCGGTSQSPIDIVSADAVTCTTRRAPEIEFPQAAAGTLQVCMEVWPIQLWPMWL